MKLYRADIECLEDASRALSGGWRPYFRMHGRAKRLCRSGLLKLSGISAMPPHVLYVITDAGRAALKTAEHENLLRLSGVTRGRP